LIRCPWEGKAVENLLNLRRGKKAYDSRQLRSKRYVYWQGAGKEAADLSRFGKEKAIKHHPDEREVSYYGARGGRKDNLLKRRF